MGKAKLFDTVFLVTGLVVQVVVYLCLPDNPWSLVSGLLGMCSVILCSQGNILTFFFGFGQIITYTYLCYLQRFYAGIAINIFYFLTQIYGVFSWRRRLHNTTGNKPASIITTRRLQPATLIVICTFALLLSAVTGYLLNVYTADGSPYLDAFTTVPALVAQLLMMLAYREQWYLWFFVDILSALMWILAGNYSMAALYIFWCINCILGYIRWTKQLETK